MATTNKGIDNIDVHVVDTDAHFHTDCSVSAVLASVEKEKKRKYSETVEVRGASFSPFVLFEDEVMGHVACCILKRLPTSWLQK